MDPSRIFPRQLVQLLNDGQMTEWWFIQANGGKMLVNDGAMSEWSYTHFTIIDEHFAIINEHFTIINEHFTIIRLKLTIIRSFDHHWEAAPTARIPDLFLFLIYLDLEIYFAWTCSSLGTDRN